jgi:hypothetical protein
MKHIRFYTLLLSCFLLNELQAQENYLLDESTRNYCQCHENLFSSDTASVLLAGFQVLETGFKMALLEKTIVKGSCWDYINEVYRRSGFADKKETIFRSNKSGPYAPAKLVQPGDWVYHINHQYNNIEHSAIFICWKDFNKRIAITLSYAGMNRNLPGKYGEYQLNSIYSIFRPKPTTDK